MKELNANGCCLNGQMIMACLAEGRLGGLHFLRGGNAQKFYYFLLLDCTTDRRMKEAISLPWDTGTILDSNDEVYLYRVDIEGIALIAKIKSLSFHPGFL